MGFLKSLADEFLDSTFRLENVCEREIMEAIHNSKLEWIEILFGKDEQKKKEIVRVLKEMRTHGYKPGSYDIRFYVIGKRIHYEWSRSGIHGREITDDFPPGCCKTYPVGIVKNTQFEIEAPQIAQQNQKLEDVLAKVAEGPYRWEIRTGYPIDVFFDEKDIKKYRGLVELDRYARPWHFWIDGPNDEQWIRNHEYFLNHMRSFENMLQTWQKITPDVWEDVAKVCTAICPKCECKLHIDGKACDCDFGFVSVDAKKCAEAFKPEQPRYTFLRPGKVESEMIAYKRGMNIMLFDVPTPAETKEVYIAFEIKR